MKGATLEKKAETKKGGPLRKRDFSLPFGHLRKEMNRLFDEFFHGEERFPMHWYPAWNELESDFKARIDVKDNDDQIVITADLPGVKLEDIEITVNRDYLRICGEKKEEKEEKEKGQYRMERSYGSFMRQIPFPCEIEKDEVDASYMDGVLRIVLPKSKESIAEERKIPVRHG